MSNVNVWRIMKADINAQLTLEYNAKNPQIVITQYDWNGYQSNCVITVPYFQSFRVMTGIFCEKVILRNA